MIDCRKYYDKRLEVLDLCSKVDKKYQDIIDKDYHILIKKMAESMYRRSEEIKDICQVDQYDLYFSGRIGIGKSTLICMMLGLIDYDKLVEGERLSDALLLKTGSGRTTVCETQISLHADETRFIVEEVPAEQFYAYLKEYCDYKLEKSTISISQEHIRVIENMVKNSKSNYAAIDDILLNSSGFSDDKEQAKFVFDKLLEACTYEERTNKVFSLVDASSNFTTWCKETFAAINDGTLASTPMPRKIILEISDDDVEIKMPSYIRSIVDTRGLEAGERPDIQTYISKPNSITMMCDRIESYGSDESILSILRQLLIPEDWDKRYRVLLLGMEKGEELENISGFEGNRTSGMCQKVVEAQRVINQQKIAFCEKNYIFANTAPSIICSSKIYAVSADKVYSSQEAFQFQIDECLNRMLSNYYTELIGSLDTLEKLSRKEIDPATMEKLNKCLQHAIASCDQLKNKVNHTLQLVEAAVTRTTLASSLRGAVNHLGIGNTADMYGTFQQCCSIEFDKHCRELKNTIIHTNKIIFDSSTELEKICLEFMNQEIDNLYQKYYTEYRENVYSYAYRNLYNSESWFEAQQFWGDGQGYYRERVWTSIQKQLASQGVEKVITSQQYMTQFADSIVAFLSV